MSKTALLVLCAVLHLIHVDASVADCTQGIRFGLPNIGKQPMGTVTVSQSSAGTMQMTVNVPTTASDDTAGLLWCISDFQVWTGTTAQLDAIIADGNPAPGQFPFKNSNVGGAKTITLDTGACNTTSLEVIAHVSIYSCSANGQAVGSDTATGYAGLTTTHDGKGKWWNSFTLPSCKDCGTTITSSSGSSSSSSTTTTTGGSSSLTCSDVSQQFSNYRMIYSGMNPKCSMEGALMMLSSYNCTIPSPGCNIAVCYTAMDRSVITNVESTCTAAAAALP